MMDYESNPYYSPENVGVKVVASVDIADSYEFDIALALEDEDGKVWFAEDSGCSCPTPFEDHDFPGDKWTQVTDRGQLNRLLDEYAPNDGYRTLAAADRADFINRVMAVVSR